MADIDTSLEQFTPKHLSEDGILSTPVNDEMDDHDMILHHVTQHDASLYALECCLSEILGV